MFVLDGVVVVFGGFIVGFTLVYHLKRSEGGEHENPAMNISAKCQDT